MMEFLKKTIQRNVNKGPQGFVIVTSLQEVLVTQAFLMGNLRNIT